MKKLFILTMLVILPFLAGCESEVEKKIVFKNTTVKNVMDQIEIISKKYDYKILDRNNELSYMKIMLRRYEDVQPAYTQTQTQSTTVKVVEEVPEKRNDFVPPGIAKKDTDPREKQTSSANIEKKEPAVKVIQTNNYGKEVYVPAKTTILEYSAFVELKKENNQVIGFAYFKSPGDAKEISAEFVKALKNRLEFEVIDLEPQN